MNYKKHTPPLIIKAAVPVCTTTSPRSRSRAETRVTVTLSQCVTASEGGGSPELRHDGTEAVAEEAEVEDREQKLRSLPGSTDSTGSSWTGGLIDEQTGDREPGHEAGPEGKTNNVKRE
jgi:hypothetical protein